MYCITTVEMFALQIEELNLDSCDASQITGLTDQYTNLETLTLSNNGLTSLKGFPNLPNLRKVTDLIVLKVYMTEMF